MKSLNWIAALIAATTTIGLPSHGAELTNAAPAIRLNGQSYFVDDVSVSANERRGGG